MRNICRGFFLFIGAFFSLSAAAQWRVKSFDAENGLQGFNFNQVLIDRDNRLWVISTGGLQRFDGFRFRTIVPSSSSTSSYIMRLQQLRNGRFVYCNTKRELRELQLKEHSWNDSLLARFDVETGLIRNIFEDAGGKLWINGDFNGVFKYIRGDTLLHSYIPDLYMSTLLATPRGIYFGSASGCVRVNGSERTDVGLPYKNTAMGCTDNDGNVWFVSEDSLLIRMNADGKVDKRINVYAFDNKAMCNTGPLFDGENGIYIGTSNGLMHYDMQSGQCTWPGWQDEHSRLMPRCGIYSLLFVSPGILWCGTWSGILRIHVSTPGITTVPIVVNKNEAGIYLRSVTVVSPDTLFGGARNGSVYRITRKGESWQTELFMTQPAIHNNAVNAICIDRDGGLWLGRNSNVLYVNGQTRSARDYPPSMVWSIDRDAEDCLWFFTNNGTGVWRLPRGADSCEAVPLDTKGATWGIFNILAENNVLLLATDHGIHYFDLQTLKTDSGHAEYNSLLKITDRCWSVCRDKRGRYYVGAQYEGLLRFDPLTGRTEKLSGEGVSVYAAVCDSAGQCWAVTGSGVMEVGSEGRGPWSYDERDGLLSSQVSFIGLRVLSGSEIVVAGQTGLTIIRPDKLFRKQTPGHLVIDHVEVGGRLVAEDLINEAAITLSYRDQQISIHLCMPDARFPERYKYRYRINEDTSWSAWLETPVLSFASFSPGDYQLHFEVQNIDGYHPGGTVLNISVTPPFWQTGLFYTAVIIIVLALFVIVIRVRIRSLRRRYHMEQVLLESQSKALRAQMNPHFIFNSLNSIQEFIIDNQSKEANRYLGKFSMMMRQIIEYSRRSTITLKEEISFLELYLELEQLRFEHRFTFGFNVNDELEGEHVPSMLVQPIVENAIKHGLAGIDRPGTISISFTRYTNNRILCIVEDNGRGREKAKQNQRAATSHESIGIENIIERLAILSPRNGSQPFVKITDLYNENGNPAGTRVEIFIPLT